MQAFSMCYEGSDKMLLLQLPAELSFQEFSNDMTGKKE